MPRTQPLSRALRVGMVLRSDRRPSCGVAYSVRRGGRLCHGALSGSGLDTALDASGAGWIRGRPARPLGVPMNDGNAALGRSFGKSRYGRHYGVIRHRPSSRSQESNLAGAARHQPPPSRALSPSPDRPARARDRRQFRHRQGGGVGVGPRRSGRGGELHRPSGDRRGGRSRDRGHGPSRHRAESGGGKGGGGGGARSNIVKPPPSTATRVGFDGVRYSVHPLRWSPLQLAGRRRVVGWG